MSAGQDIERALAQISEPLFNRTLSDLGLAVEVQKPLFGGLLARVPLVVPNHPEADLLEQRAREATVGKAAVELTPLDDDARRDLMNRLREAAGPQVGQPGSATRVMAIASGKGGVGKSSVTTNLAVALARRGRTVGVIDADIWGFSIPRMLGVGHPPVVIDQSIIPPVAHGVKAISMDYFVPEDKAVIWRGPMLHKAIEQFLTDVFWDAPDYLLVDMPPGTGDIAISLSQFLPRAQVLLVTTPQLTAQRVARRAALMAETVNQEVMGVIENMSWFRGDDGKRYHLFGEGGGQALAEEVGVPLLGRIPLVPAMREGADRAMPVELAAPESDAAEAFRDLAAKVEERRPRVRSHPQLVIKS